MAGDCGFEAPSLEKVIRLAELLEAIDKHSLLGNSLALKGGTALNLFSGPPHRLSVDLDFNLTGPEGKQSMQAVRPDIEQAIVATGRAQGYSVQLSRNAHANRKFFLSYQRIFDGQQDRVEIDVNFLNRVALLRGERGRIWRPDGPGAETTLASWTEIAAGKLVALLDRAAPRDAWDTARLPELFKSAWSPPHLRAIFIAIAGTLPRPLYEYGQSSFDRIRDSDVKRQLHPMLSHAEHPTGKELRRKAWDVVAPFLELDEAEIEFCSRLQQGELIPELLFPEEPEIADHLQRHPPLLWKAENARRFQGR